MFLKKLKSNQVIMTVVIISSDLFLYARCCAVANGKDFYQEVLSDPAKMPKDLTFEALLYLAEKAYRRKTGKRLDRAPAYIYETFFNPAGWGEKAIQFGSLTNPVIILKG